MALSLGFQFPMPQWYWYCIVRSRCSVIAEQCNCPQRGIVNSFFKKLFPYSENKAICVFRTKAHLMINIYISREMAFHGVVLASPPSKRMR